MSMCDLAQDFLAQKCVAVIGVSRNPKDFSRSLVTLLRRSIRVFAVNPRVHELDGEPCYPAIADIPAIVDGVVLMLPDTAIDQAIRECAAVNVPRIWVYGVGHPRKVSLESVKLCQEKKIALINGLCPRMFLKGTAWPHRLHKWVSLRTRAYRPTPA